MCENPRSLAGVGERRIGSVSIDEENQYSTIAAKAFCKNNNVPELNETLTIAMNNLERNVRNQTIDKAIVMFRGLNWLCLDHGGDEMDEIISRLNSLKIQ